MKDVTDKNFGLLIAFLLPGFICLWGLSYSSQEVATWLAKSSSKESLTVGGFLYSTLASLSLGLIISAVRWLLIDHLLGLIGVKSPKLNFKGLNSKDTAAAFKEAVENHYRFYQYYSNTLIAIACAFGFYFSSNSHAGDWKLWVLFVVLVLILFFGSRDALKKYYDRAAQILGVEGA